MSVTDHLHTSPGRVQRTALGPCDRTGVPTGKPRIHSEQIQACPRTNPDNRVLGVLSEFYSTGAESSQWEGKKDQVRDSASDRCLAIPGEETVPASREAPVSNQSNPLGSLVLPQTAADTKRVTGSVRTRLLQALRSLHRGERGAPVVV